MPQHVTPIEPRLVDVRSAATALGISRSLLYQLMADRAIETVKIRDRRLISVAEIDRFAAEQTRGAK